MTIQLTITLRDSDELKQFAEWYDARNDNPIAYSVTEKAEAAKFDPPVEAKVEPIVGTRAHVVTTKKEAPPAANDITREDFEKAVKTWFAQDGKTRGPVVKDMIASFGVEKLSDVPAEHYVSIISKLGIS